MKQTLWVITLCLAVLFIFDQSPRGWTEQRVDTTLVPDLVTVDNAVPFP